MACGSGYGPTIHVRDKMVFYVFFLRKNGFLCCTCKKKKFKKSIFWVEKGSKYGACYRLNHVKTIGVFLSYKLFCSTIDALQINSTWIGHFYFLTSIIIESRKWICITSCVIVSFWYKYFTDYFNWCSINLKSVLRCKYFYHSSKSS